MAYGITSSSQLIDVDTIRSACEQYKAVLDDFDRCGSTVVQAGETCSAKALSVDESSLTASITDLGEDIQGLKTTFSTYADQLLADAITVYNQQVAELNEYNRRLSEQQNQSNN